MTRRSTPRIAIVTGASRRRGIGAAIAAALAQEGFDLGLVHHDAADEASGLRDPSGVAGVASDVLASCSMPVRIETIDVDLSRRDAPETVFERVRSRLGGASVLINNAAHSMPGRVDDLDADTIDRHLGVNLRAPMLLSRLLLRQLPDRWGRIVNLTSGQGLAPMPAELAYASSKGALEAFTVSLAPDAAASGVTVNAIDPGPTDSGWMSDADRERATGPGGRVGRPDDAGRLARWLCSREADRVTGQVIRSRGSVG